MSAHKTCWTKDVTIQKALARVKTTEVNETSVRRQLNGIALPAL
jgi:hypothetical protein